MPVMPKPPLPSPPTLGELLAGPVVLNLHQTCIALRMRESRAYELLAAGTFPVGTIEPRRRGVPLLFRLADVLAFLGFDPADIAREPTPSLSSSPAGDRERRNAA
jgi:hypothetical protein